MLGAQGQALPRPIDTPMLDGPTAGAASIGLAVEREQDVRFPLSGLRGDLSQLGVYTVHLPVSPNVEFRITGTARSELYIRQRGPSRVRLDIDTVNNRTGDVGDLVVGSVVRIVDEDGSVPAVGFWAAARLPNANETKGIGTNTTDLYFTLLLGRRLGPVRLSGSLGLGILDDPTDAFNENDVLLYGLAAVLAAGRGTRVFLDLNGWVSSRVTTPVGTEPRGRLRAGADRRIGRVTLDASILVGLTEVSADWGLGVGTTVELGAGGRGGGR